MLKSKFDHNLCPAKSNSMLHDLFTLLLQLEFEVPCDKNALSMNLTSLVRSRQSDEGLQGRIYDVGDVELSPSTSV